MIQQLRKIGNSSGIIIPKTMLDSCEINDNVEMEVIQNMIIIKPLRKKARENWDSKFKQANSGIDGSEIDLFDGITNDFDLHEW